MEIKDAEDAEWRSAQTFIVEPSGALINTQHVIRRELKVTSVARLNVTGLFELE